MILLKFFRYFYYLILGSILVGILSMVQTLISMSFIEIIFHMVLIICLCFLILRLIKQLKSKGRFLKWSTTH